MGRSKKFNWSELYHELLQCVFKRLSFTDLNRAKSVCSSWHTASRGCVPHKNQIPWLILFPQSNENKNKSSCVLFIPDDIDSVSETRDLGDDFMRSRCVAIYGTWLLMMDTNGKLNILNPLTGERIDLPITTEPISPEDHSDFLACFWIDERSRDYMVVQRLTEYLIVFIKKGNSMWRPVSDTYNCWGSGSQMVYDHKSEKLYLHHTGDSVKIWCFAGDNPQRVFEHYYAPICFTFWDFLPDRSKDEELYLKEEELYVKEYVDSKLNIVVSTVSGDVYKVASAVQKSKRWLLCVSKMNPIKLTWEVIDSLKDEALLLDMGITVVAKDIPEIKSNSIYFSGMDYGRENPDHIFVFDFTTHEIQRLPHSTLSSIHFSDARWFFPTLTRS